MKKDVFANELTMEVVVGVFIVLLMVGLTYFTFVVSGSKWGKQTENIDVVFRSVMGLRERDTVMVRGMPVGEVKTLRLEPNGVHVNLEVSEPLDMREDYAISIVPSSVFGGRYVRVYEGTSAEALPLSFSFIGQEPTDLMDDAAEVMNAARKDLTGDGGVIENLKVASVQIRGVAERLNRGEGLLGGLLSAEDTLYSDLKSGIASLRTVIERVEKGEGALGKLLSAEDTIYADVQASMASLREISQRLEKGQGMMGRLLAEDDTLYKQLEELLDEARAALDDVRETTPVVTFTSVLFGAF